MNISKCPWHGFTTLRKFWFSCSYFIFFIVFWGFPLLSCELSYAFQLNNVYFILHLRERFQRIWFTIFLNMTLFKLPNFFVQCTAVQQSGLPKVSPSTKSLRQDLGLLISEAVLSFHVGLVGAFFSLQGLIEQIFLVWWVSVHRDSEKTNKREDNNITTVSSSKELVIATEAVEAICKYERGNSSGKEG